MTTIKPGQFKSVSLPKLDSQEGATGKAKKGDSPPPDLSKLLAQVGDAFEKVKNQVMDITGARVSQTGGVGGTGRAVVNPALEKFLAENPQIKTVQDFVNYCYDQPKGDRFFRDKCAELGLDQVELSKARSANMSDYVYSGPELAPNLPHSAAEANANFITQFGNDTYNPDGAKSTTNCGPTSLAMALRTAGQMPQGLTPEQQIDYARALMYPNAKNLTYLDVDGKKIPQLDQDHTFTDISAITQAANGVGMGGQQGTGWAAIDDALASGKPVVCPGNVSTDWKNQFPDSKSYHQEGNGHFIAVLGRTPDGKYLVADPLYPGGVVEMTRKQLATFFQGSNNTEPKFAAIGPPA